MTQRTNSTRTLALVAGISIIIMALAAGYSYGYVMDSLVITDDATATLSNLNNSGTLYGTAVIGWVIILITDIVVSWSLYRFFAKFDERISLATGLMRAIYSVILGYAIFHLLIVWQLLPAPNHLAADIIAALADFENYWSFGLIIFGVHLIGLGFLSYRSGMVPRWIGFLLYVAGAGYTLIHGSKAIMPEFSSIISTVEMFMSIPMAVAELALAVWLIRKGGRTPHTIKS